VPSPLDHIDYNQWQGLTPNKVKARWPEQLDTWYSAPNWAAIPGDETL
jgi:broad specificity phosphatase PhoE